MISCFVFLRKTQTQKALNSISFTQSVYMVWNGGKESVIQCIAHSLTSQQADAEMRLWSHLHGRAMIKLCKLALQCCTQDVCKKQWHVLKSKILSCCKMCLGRVLRGGFYKDAAPPAPVFIFAVRLKCTCVY